MPYFTSTVLFICLFWALIALCCSCSVVTFTGCAAIWEAQVNFGTAAYEIPNCAKLWYRTIWNIINTGNFTVPAAVYHASLVRKNMNKVKQTDNFNKTNIQMKLNKQCFFHEGPLTLLFRYVMARGGKSTKIFYSSKSTITLLKFYLSTSKSTSLKIYSSKSKK